MMNILTAMYARMIRCWLIIRRTVPDTGNTRAAESSVKDVYIHAFFDFDGKFVSEK